MRVIGNLTWAQARDDAVLRGGHLATVTSLDEHNQLVAQVGSPGSSWLGGTDEAVEGTWKWITGEPWNYTRWSSGEPNNNGGEHYLQYANNANMLWNDAFGTTISGSYILEIDNYLGLTLHNVENPAVGYADTNWYHDCRVVTDWSSFIATNPSVDGLLYAFSTNPAQSIGYESLFYERTQTSTTNMFPNSGQWWIHAVPVIGSAIDTNRLSHLRVMVDSNMPTVVSSTHADPTNWYAAVNVNLSWTPSHGDFGSIPRSFFEWDRNPSSVPTTGSPSSAAFVKTYFNQTNGTWYFHVRTQDRASSLSDTRHFRVNIGDPSAGDPPVAADFSAAPLSGYAPLTVTFTDAATGGITNRQWDYNADGIADATNPAAPIQFTYATPGTYTVSFAVDGPDGSAMSLVSPGLIPRAPRPLDRAC